MQDLVKTEDWHREVVTLIIAALTTTGPIGFSVLGEQEGAWVIAVYPKRADANVVSSYDKSLTLDATLISAELKVERLLCNAANAAIRGTYMGRTVCVVVRYTSMERLPGPVETPRGDANNLN